MISGDLNRIWEFIMRHYPLGIALSLALACVASVAQGQLPDNQINPRSTALVEQGRQMLARADYIGAANQFETALAVDPRNRGALIALAEVARAQELPGKAVRLYREALQMDPNDLAALEGQGEALVQRGAVTKAQANLARIKTLCKTECAPATRLTAAIAKGPPPAVVAQSEATTVPTPTEAEKGAN